MIWIILATLLVFIYSYTTLWVEQPSQITEMALAKYCLQDLKHQFIGNTLSIVSTALYFADKSINDIKARLSFNPAAKATFHAIEPQLRYFIVLEITKATLSRNFYSKERCGKIDFWILCGNASLSNIDAGDVNWWASPGYFSTNIKKCNWEDILKINKTQATICFDCVNIYASTYIGKKVIYVDKIRGVYNISAGNITDIIIPYTVNKRLQKYS